MAPKSQGVTAVAMLKPTPKSSQTFLPRHVQRRTLHATKAKLDCGVKVGATGTDPDGGAGSAHAGEPPPATPCSGPPSRRPPADARSVRRDLLRNLFRACRAVVAQPGPKQTNFRRPKSQRPAAVARAGLF